MRAKRTIEAARQNLQTAHDRVATATRELEELKAQTTAQKEKARLLGVYDRLLAADVLETLQAEVSAYDLIIAADVFVYIGKLDDIFAASHRALRPGGIFAFSVEADETTDHYRLRQSGRYGHAAGYLRDLATRHGFRESSMREVVLRKEAGVPMHGYLFVFTRP